MIVQTSQQVIFIKIIGADLELVTLTQAPFMKYKSMCKTDILKVMVVWDSIRALHVRSDFINQTTK